MSHITKEVEETIKKQVHVYVCDNCGKEHENLWQISNCVICGKDICGCYGDCSKWIPDYFEPDPEDDHAWNNNLMESGYCCSECYPQIKEEFEKFHKLRIEKEEAFAALSQKIDLVVQKRHLETIAKELEKESKK